MCHHEYQASHGKYADSALGADVLYARNIILSVVCVGCIVGTKEAVNPMLLYCDVAHNIWDWMSGVLLIDFQSFPDAAAIVKWDAKQDAKNTMAGIVLCSTCFLEKMEVQD